MINFTLENIIIVSGTIALYVVPITILGLLINKIVEKIFEKAYEANI